MEEQGAERPSVDVVVPFAGSDAELESVARGLGALLLGPGDSATLVDNRPSARDRGAVSGVQTVPAPERQSSYYARNRGAAKGAAEWLLFVDADVTVPPDLLDRYFERAPASDVGLLAGAIDDVETGRSTAVGRFLTRSASMSQSNTLRGEWAYAQTANCAVRRTAFDQVGGFNDTIRSGGDADLCFRLRLAGWSLEARDEAGVAHHARTSLKALVRQRARHGSGTAWLNREYPGSFPPAWRGLVKWTLVSVPRIFLLLARGNREGASEAVVEQASSWAFHLGRLVSNQVPPGGDAVRR